MRLMRFEVYAKYGRNWSFKGIYEAESSRGAALKAGYVHSRRVLGVRPEDSTVKLLVHRFGFTPGVHHGR